MATTESAICAPSPDTAAMAGLASRPRPRKATKALPADRRGIFSHMLRSRPQRARLGVVSIALRLIAYFATAWGTIAVLSAGVASPGPVIVLAIAVSTTIPLLSLIPWPGSPFYPGAAFRLLVVRQFW